MYCGAGILHGKSLEHCLWFRRLGHRSCKLSGVAVTVVVAGVAVPDRVTVCGEFVALSVTAIFPVRFPAVVGANVAVIVQLAPPANVDGATGQLVLD